MKLALVLGTRPEIIKMASVILECEKRDTDYYIVHTGQHFSYNMDQLFFEELGLPRAHYHLGIKPSSPSRQGEHTGKMLIGIEEVFLKDRPDMVLVQGDTNTVLAGSLCASKLHILLGHIEAGLRSYDKVMPEEVNRRIADHLADYLYVPTSNGKNLVIREGIHNENVIVTGNTIVDAVALYKEKAHERSILSSLGLQKGKYFLATAHRPENVDHYDKLQNLLRGLGRIHNEYEFPVVFPVHPRTKKSIDSLKPEIPAGIQFIEPLGFYEFLDAEANAKLLLTDSGGVQEEACILGVPCVTLRENTERPETVEVGSNMLAGTDPERIADCAGMMIKRRRSWKNPFGDGQAGKRILEHILSLVNEQKKS